MLFIVALHSQSSFKFFTIELSFCSMASNVRTDDLNLEYWFNNQMGNADR